MLGVIVVLRPLISRIAKANRPQRVAKSSAKPKARNDYGDGSAPNVPTSEGNVPSESRGGASLYYYCCWCCCCWNLERHASKQTKQVRETHKTSSRKAFLFACSFHDLPISVEDMARINLCLMSVTTVVWLFVFFVETCDT